MTTSRSNPLARATPRAKRAKPASRSTHKTLLKWFSFPSLGVSSPSPPTDETSDAASTLILGPSERSSKAPRSAPARFRTAEMPRASRRAATTSFQRATPSAPHSACAAHAQTHDEEEEEKKSFSSSFPSESSSTKNATRPASVSARETRAATATRPSGYVHLVSPRRPSASADAAGEKVTVRSRPAASASSGADDRMTASRISSRPSPPSIDRAPTSIHHQDIAATASVADADEKNESDVRIVATKDSALVASSFFLSPASATREGAREGTQSWYPVVSTPESGTRARFVNSKTSETRVTQSSKKRAWTRVRAAAGHARVSAGAAAFSVSVFFFRSLLRVPNPSSRFKKNASPRFEPATSCAKRRVFLGITVNAGDGDSSERVVFVWRSASNTPSSRRRASARKESAISTASATAKAPRTKQSAFSVATNDERGVCCVAG